MQLGGSGHVSIENPPSKEGWLLGVESRPLNAGKKLLLLEYNPS